MIKIAPEYIMRFIEYLNKNYPTDEDCYITFYHGEKCIEYICKSCEQCISFAEYDKISKILYIPTQYPTDKNPKFLLESIAHEYIHHIQNCENRLNDDDRKFLEIEAKDRAIKIVENYLNI